MLQRIHTLPEAYRRKLAVGITTALTLVVVALWIITKPFMYSTINTTEAEKAQANAVTPLQSLSGDAKGTYNAIKERVQTLLNEVKK